MRHGVLAFGDSRVTERRREMRRRGIDAFRGHGNILNASRALEDVAASRAMKTVTIDARRASATVSSRSRFSSQSGTSEDATSARALRTVSVTVMTAIGAFGLVRASDSEMAESFEYAAYGAATPAFRALDPELAHDLGIAMLELGLGPRQRTRDSESLTVRAFGTTFANPIGLAAGFDKDARAFEALMKMGFGFVEIGSVTPQPQPGNPKPRAFRLIEHGAVINRYGFNSKGHESAKGRLAAYRAREDVPAGVLGVNLGKNKTTPEANAANDYVLGVDNIGEYGDYIVVNVSSPNTPGLRNLQGRKHLSGLLRKVLSARDRNPATAKKPVLVKIAPDLTDAEIKDVASVVKSEKVDGVIVSNTTVARPEEIKAHKHGDEAGGLSGKPLMESSTRVLHELYRLTGGKIPLVGCGGVASGEDAYAKIRAGATLVQLYTAFAFGGPPLILKIKRELEECLARDGFKSVEEAIGVAHRKR